MAKRHMKRQTAPRSWPINRKGSKFITRPQPGKSFKLGMPLSLIFKDLLKLCKTTKEVKNILNDKEILVDGKRRKEPRYLVGFGDIIAIPVSNDYFRLLLNRKGKLSLVTIDKDESAFKLCRIIGKKVLKKGTVQLNCHDGMNVLVKKDTFKVGSTIIIELATKKVTGSFELESKSHIMLTGGAYIGQIGTIDNINNGEITFKDKEGIVKSTKKDYAFVIGKEKPAIKVDE